VLQSVHTGGGAHLASYWRGTIPEFSLNDEENERKHQLNYSVSRPTSKQGAADEKFRIFTYYDRVLERIK
jgi:hypothetical protein